MSIDINVTFDPIPDLPAEAYTALRGLKGDQGDQGVQGVQGNDGFSPIATVEKVGDTATITITDANGTTTATVSDGASGGATAFVAELNVTPYADVKDAYDDGAIILCTVDDNGNTVVLQLAYFDDGNEAFYFAQPHSDGWYWTGLSNGFGWDDGFVQFASTDTATALRDGLMSALDYQKLSAIESGAEVNVQSDWNEADSTADDFIKNKPSIPTTAGEVGAVPTTRTVNGKALSSDITLTASDVGAPTYTAGTGIDITNGVISLDLSQAEGEEY